MREEGREYDRVRSMKEKIRHLFINSGIAESRQRSIIADGPQIRAIGTRRGSSMSPIRERHV